MSKNTRKKRQNKNIAIFFSGRITAYEHTTGLDDLYEKYNCTLFCSLNMTHTTPYLDTFFEKYNMGPEQIHFEKTIYPEWLFSLKRHPWSIYENIFSCLYHNRLAFNLIENYTNNYRVNFDAIIYYRSDIHSSQKLRLIKPVKSTIYIPDGENGGHPDGFLEEMGMTSGDEYGTNSTLAYGSFNTMKTYCSIIERLWDMCTNHNTDIHHERIIKRGLELNNIIVYRFQYDYVLHPKRHDSDYIMN